MHGLLIASYSCIFSDKKNTKRFVVIVSSARVLRGIDLRASFLKSHLNMGEVKGLTGHVMQVKKEDSAAEK